MSPGRALASLALAVLLAGCSGTATTLNLGTWNRFVEPLAYCTDGDGSGRALVRVRRMRAYDLPGASPPPGAESTGLLAFRAADVETALAAAHESWRWSEQVADGRTLTRQKVQVTASAGAASWRLTPVDPAAAPDRARCDPGVAGYSTDGIPVTWNGESLYVVLDVVVAPEARRQTVWWHWPALALVPLGVAVDVVTFPAQVGVALFYLNQINRGPPRAVEQWLLLGALVVVLVVYNWLLWRFARALLRWRRRPPS